MALKESKGSAQDRQVHSALQGVEPKWLISRVSGEPQCGQRTENASITGPSVACAAGPGGAIPYSRSLRRPLSLIQSVVHAGASTVRTRTWSAPARRRAT